MTAARRERSYSLDRSEVRSTVVLAGPPADVLLVDLGLPDGSGIELIRAARNAWPTCEIMVTSVFGDEAHVLLSIQAPIISSVISNA